MKRYLIAALSFCVAASACGGESSSSRSSATNTGSPIAATPLTDTTDTVSDITFSAVVTLNLTDKTIQFGSGSTQTLSSSAVSGLSSGSASVSAETTTEGISITSTLSEPVKYVLSGTLSGTLTIESDAQYQLYLNNATINPTDGPALNLQSKSKVFFVSANSTTNSFSDSSSRTTLTQKSAVYAKGPMIFSGEGSISVTGSYKHGVSSNNYVHILSGTISINTSVKDGINTVNGFVFDDGTLTIKATGTTTDDESKGIKVTGEEGSDTAGMGYVVINDGTLNITSVSKGISAAWDIDDDATTSSTADDPYPFIEINGGTITVTTTGTPYETKLSDGTTVSCSPEGIEAKEDLIINDGLLTISTADDCINAGSNITINGGYLYCKSSSNDSIDSNGTLDINGGVIVSIGSNGVEGPFDCDTNTFSVTGGIFVGIGGTVSSPTASACTQNVAIIGSVTSGQTMALKASDGSVVFAFTIPQSYTTMIFSSPEIASKTSYTVYSGGTASAPETFKGLFIPDESTAITYSGGSATSRSFTTSSTVSQSGGTIFGAR